MFFCLATLSFRQRNCVSRTPVILFRWMLDGIPGKERGGVKICVCFWGRAGEETTIVFCGLGELKIVFFSGEREGWGAEIV